MAWNRAWRGWLGLATVVVAAALPTGAAPRGITVAAASDLQLAFTELGAAFRKETGVPVTFTFGSSGTLARQVENGAPVDLYAAANEEFVAQLEAKGRTVAGTRRVYAVGMLVLARYRGSGTEIGTLRELRRAGIRHVAMANPEHAPYGAAARQALQRAGVWEALRPKLVIGESVRHALQFVQTGNAECGLVARSVVGVPEVSWVEVDPRLYDPLRQALAVIRGSRNTEAAQRFADYVSGPRARAVMERYGYRASPAVKSPPATKKAR